MKNLFLACLFLGSTFGYGAKENKGLTKPKLQIGLVFPFSGSLSRFGDDLLKGFTLAHENLKKENPDLAARVQFIVQDNKGLTSLTEASTLKLIKEQHPIPRTRSPITPTRVSTALDQTQLPSLQVARRDWR